MWLKNIVIVCFTCILWISTNAQIAVNTVVSPIDLVNEIVGFGIKVSNVNLVCPQNASGIFTAGDVINEGIILTTGNANNASGPNTNVNTSTNHGASGDMDLDNIAGGFTTYDACILEFDIIPYCDEIDFSFLFASEEYPEYVGRAFNDVFGIFITGPNPLNIAAPYNKLNIATIAGAPITVNSVNSGSNAAFYTDNLTNNTEYDGLTIQIDKAVPVFSCSTYHIKIGIADGDDGIFDAALLLKKHSLDCGIGYKSSTDFVSLREGCEKTIDITRPNTLVKDTVLLEFYGTAINSVDLIKIPDSLFFEIGEDTKTIILNGIEDNLAESVEQLFIVYENGPCGIKDTIRVLLDDEINLDPGPDRSVCDKDSVIIGGIPLGIPGAIYTWTPNTRLSNPNISNPKVEGSNNGNVAIDEKYYIEVDYNGCKYNDSMIVRSFPTPVAGFNNNVSACLNDTAFFTNTTVSTYSYTNRWDFGNMNSAIGDNVNELYAFPGNYEVMLISKDINNCSDTAKNNIIINPKPASNFSFTNVCIGNQICFNDLSGITTGAVVAWNWTLDNISVNNQNPCVTYNTTGVKNIKLKTTSDQGCVDSISKVATVYQNPVVNYTSAGLCRNDSISFINYSTSGSGFISNYEWFFGDGQIGNIRNPKNKYLLDGVYPTKLIVTNSRGCKDSLSQNITIYKEPTVDFTSKTVTSCQYECVDFMNLSADIYPLTYYEWNFGNGEVSNDTNPTHCFKDTGVFSVSLLATNDKGCSASILKNNYLTVYPNPIAYFEVDKRVLKNYDSEILITDHSTSNINKYIWNFGDGNYDSTFYVSAFEYPYQSSGDYNIKLFVRDINGCTDDFTLRISVENNSILYLPNVFTPDGDGINDFFFAEGLNLESLENFELLIFNRWGDVIFKTNDYNDKWNGMHKGKIAKQDVYVYKLKYITAQGEEETVHGTVTLLK